MSFIPEFILRKLVRKEVEKKIANKSSLTYSSISPQRTDSCRHQDDTLNYMLLYTAINNSSNYHSSTNTHGHSFDLPSSSSSVCSSSSSDYSGGSSSYSSSDSSSSYSSCDSGSSSDSY